MSARLKVEMRFICRSAMHVTGDRMELWTDKALAVDWHDGKTPVIPATSIKGWLRENVERALRALGVDVCDASSPSSSVECPVCRVFGNPRIKSPLRFQDVKLYESLTNVRMGVSLSRYRRSAYEDRLFSQEAAWTPEFIASVYGIFPDEEDARTAAALLWLGAKLGFATGGARTRGLGWVELRDFKASINGKDIGVKKLNSALESKIEVWKEEVGYG